MLPASSVVLPVEGQNSDSLPVVYYLILFIMKMRVLLMFLIFQYGPLRRISDKSIWPLFFRFIRQKKTIKKRRKGKQKKDLVFGKHKSCYIYVQMTVSVKCLQNGDTRNTCGWFQCHPIKKIVTIQ